MANHKSAAKRARQSEKRAARNRPIKSVVRKSVRRFNEALSANDKTDGEAKLAVATRLLRKAASKGVLHKRTASRRVSRLVRAANKLANS